MPLPLVIKPRRDSRTGSSCPSAMAVSAGMSNRDSFSTTFPTSARSLALLFHDVDVAVGRHPGDRRALDGLEHSAGCGRRAGTRLPARAERERASRGAGSARAPVSPVASLTEPSRERGRAVRHRTARLVRFRKSVRREAVEQAGAAGRRQLLHRAALRRDGSRSTIDAGIAAEAVRMTEHRGRVRAVRPVVARGRVLACRPRSCPSGCRAASCAGVRRRVPREIRRRRALLGQRRRARELVVRAVQVRDVLRDQLALDVVPGAVADAVLGVDVLVDR